jgi:hypothetical protein
MLVKFTFNNGEKENLLRKYEKEYEELSDNFAATSFIKMNA